MYDSRARGPGFNTQSCHILSFLFLLIQEGCLLLKYVHLVLVYPVGRLSLPGNCVVRLADLPDMTIAVYRGCKQQHNMIKKSYSIFPIHGTSHNKSAPCFIITIFFKFSFSVLCIRYIQNSK